MSRMFDLEDGTFSGTFDLPRTGNITHVTLSAEIVGEGQDGMYVEWYANDDWNPDQLLDSYVVSEGDGNFPKHEGRLKYNWGVGEAIGNDWERGDFFSAKWTGYVWPPYTVNGILRLHSDDYSWVEVGGNQVTHAWYSRDGFGAYEFEQGKS